MQIEKLQSLLRDSGKSEARVFVKSNRKGGRGKVCIAYTPAGKVYEYSGSVASIAQRLGFTPSTHVPQAARWVVQFLKTMPSYTDLAELADTVAFLSSSQITSDDSGQVDEWDRPLRTYRLRTAAEMHNLGIA